MVGERNGIWPSRLARFVAVIAIGVGVTLLFANYLKNSNTVSTPIDLTSAEEAAIDDSHILDHPLDPVLQIAKQSLEHMRSSVVDYTATFEKQERVQGKLAAPEVIEMKVMNRSQASATHPAIPMHVYLRFMAPSQGAGREIIWVNGQNDNKLVAHEAGFLNLIRVNLDPHGTLAMAGNKHGIDQVGIERLLEKLIERGRKYRQIPECIVELQGNYDWDGVPVQRVTVTMPNKSTYADFHFAEILIDPKNQLPISYSSYLWPDSDQQQMPLEERYVYRDLKINVGLTEEDFNPDNPAYNFP